MFFLKAFKSLIAVLHSSDSPLQVAFGLALGALIGLNPLSTLQTMLLFIILMGTKSNLKAAVLAMPLFAALGFLLDPLSHRLGYVLLVQTPALTPLWTAGYNAPLIPFTRFNNTIVLGSFILGLILFIPLVLAGKAGVVYYRAHLQERMENMKIMKFMSITRWVALWEKSKQ